MTSESVELAREFLEKVLRVQRLHVFGELSKGQMIEKFEFLKMHIDSVVKKGAKSGVTQDILINIITLGPMKLA